MKNENRTDYQQHGKQQGRQAILHAQAQELIERILRTARHPHRRRRSCLQVLPEESLLRLPVGPRPQPRAGAPPGARHYRPALHPPHVQPAQRRVRLQRECAGNQSQSSAYDQYYFNCPVALAGRQRPRRRYRAALRCARPCPGKCAAGALPIRLDAQPFDSECDCKSQPTGPDSS